MRLIPAGLLLLLTLTACRDPAGAQAAEAAKLLETDRAFAAQSLDQGTATAFYTHMREDAIQLPANAPPLQGSRRIRDRLGALGLQVLERTPRQAEVARGLDLGWTWGEWRLLQSAASRQVLAHGKYLNVWKRTVDGSWQLAADIGNRADEDPLTPP